MGKISKGVRCSVEGCGREAARSLPVGKVTAAGLEVEGTRRAYLCRDHYKEYKKATRKQKMIDKWRHGGRTRHRTGLLLG